MKKESENQSEHLTFLTKDYRLKRDWGILLAFFAFASIAFVFTINIAGIVISAAVLPLAVIAYKHNPTTAAMFAFGGAALAFVCGMLIFLIDHFVF